MWLWRLVSWRTTRVRCYDCCRMDPAGTAFPAAMGLLVAVGGVVLLALRDV
ncbi:hypothetical protein ACFXKX_18095 [Streptomyces scopuliridis]|uniref:hypothetical protein n=1 Tax=Streptomyces scopuliridis TaxID=452529 RepID=UPI0036BC2C68